MRIDKLDVAKGIGIICVIISHCYIGGSVLQKWLYAFHMPLFFFISGLFYKKRECKNFLVARFRSLLVPYLFFAVSSTVLYVIIVYYSSSLQLEKHDVMDKIIGIFYAHASDRWMFNITIWFLPCLYILENLYNFIKNQFPDKHINFIVIGIFILGCFIGGYENRISIWSFDVAFVAIIFYHLGFLCKKYVIESRSKKLTISLSFFLSLVSIIIVNYVSMVDMSHSEYGNPIVFVFQAFLGIVLIVSLSDLLSKSAMLAYFGKNSLIILGTHTLILMIFPGVLVKLGVDMSIDTTKTIISFVVCIALLPIVIYILNEYFYFLLGKSKKSI